MIQPVEANSEEEAIEIFKKTLDGKARDIDIEEVLTDEEKVIEIIGEAQHAEAEEDDTPETLH